MGSLSIWHWMIVIVVVMLMFGGRGKISGLMGDFAQGIKAFKKGMAEDDDKPAEAKAEPVKTIDSNAAGTSQAKTEQRAESAHS
jgi:sec-independent protein translocase protein TatA